jgi:hypothetical protein
MFPRTGRAARWVSPSRAPYFGRPESAVRGDSESIQAGPVGPASLIVGFEYPDTSRARCGPPLRSVSSLADGVPRPVSRLSGEALEESTFARDPRAKHWKTAVIGGQQRCDEMLIELGLFKLVLFRIFVRGAR